MIRIRRVRKAPVDDIMALYRDAGWWDDKFASPGSWIPGVVSGAFRFLGAFDGRRMVGMVRALSDGVSDAYIVDVVVLKSYRGQGIARRLVETLVEELVKLEIDWIVGIAVPGSFEFYKKLGVKAMEGYTPMRFGHKG